MYNQFMIQDILPKKFKNEYKRVLPEPRDIVLAFRGREVLCALGDNGAVGFPRAEEIKIDKNKLIYLFEIDEDRFFLVNIDYSFDEQNISENKNPEKFYQYEDIRVLRKANPGYLCYAGMTAYHLYMWYRDNKFCGRCGKNTEIYDVERALKCPVCGNIIYPKIAPAVIVGVTNGTKILMTRYAGRPYKGNALIAGFCEIGETAEDTVRREVLEEVGVRVKNIRYFGSQPWGFDSNLLLGYFCELDGSDEIKLDKNELAIAEWVERHDIGEEAKNLSLTGTMMMYFKENPAFFS
ncbi:NAD(+) diphosphatase [Butyrivibrio sp. JL13D10]|uniref:NAD(+) diphosphatase n=1 Tax=Butyrivibrio sp. JL13D10 TaxID=3236815 RepID=UPI0038B6A1A4